MTESQRPQQNRIALNPLYLESEEALLRSLMQSADYGILLSGLDRQDILANQKLGELFACEAQEVVEGEPDSVRQMTHAIVKDPAEFDRRLEETYRDALCTYEDELELATTPPRILRRYTAPVIDLDGNALARIWTFLDISETKRLQAQVEAQLVKRTEDFLTTQGFLLAMNDLFRMLITCKELDELIVGIVKRVAEIAGFGCAGLLMFHPTDLSLKGAICIGGEGVRPMQIDTSFSKLLSKNLKRDRDPGKPKFQFFQDRTDPLLKLFNCEVLGISPLYGHDGLFGLFLLGKGEESHKITLDALHLEQLQALLVQIVLCIEGNRLQSSLHSAMVSLRQTQRKLVEMEKLKTAGTLAASIAHDIRNILATMQMEVQMLPCDTSGLQDHLNRFSALTHRLLAFSRPQVLETELTNLIDILRRVMPMIQGQADIQGVTLSLLLPDVTSLIQADSSQLDHLFVNLSLNALQAMPRGGSLTFRLESDSNWVSVHISDTGCGISPEIMPRLFDPFFTTRANGFGLGLFSCKSIVEEHGGELKVVSELGRGSCFTVQLPANQVRARVEKE